MSDFPHDEVGAGVDAHPHGRRALEDLRTELASESPDPAQVERHVGVLREIPAIGHIVENWFDSPSTQRWLAALNGMGL